jgi:hypothetical protein
MLICPLRDKLHGKQPKSGMQPVRLTQKKRKHFDLPPAADVKKIKIPPKVCTQTTVTIDLAETDRTAQKYPHGSPRWQHVYKNDRNLVEGANAWVKTGGYEALHDAGRRRLRGLAAQQILITFLLVAANVRRILAYKRDHQDAKNLGPPYMGHRANRRRDRIGYGNYTAAARELHRRSPIQGHQHLKRPDDPSRPKQRNASIPGVFRTRRRCFNDSRRPRSPNDPRGSAGNRKGRPYWL